MASHIATARLHPAATRLRLYIMLDFALLFEELRTLFSNCFSDLTSHLVFTEVPS
jgi:hypothetical protein